MNPETLKVRGVATRVLRNGTAGTPLVFVHGGVPGATPYCSGAHLWGPVLERFGAERAVVALDLPGSGGTQLAGDVTVDLLSQHLRATLEALEVRRCHLVAHDLAGLLALNLAADAPELVAAVTAVASVAAAPSGDGVDNLTFAHPPEPKWQRESQRWALERISYSHHHIDEALLDACTAAAESAPHREAVQRAAAGALADAFVPSLMKAKSRLYELCRTTGVPAACQVVWGSHDPLGSFDQALWLFRGLAQKQRVAQFHVVNRAGALPFREEPQAFHAVVSAFADAVLD